MKLSTAKVTIRTKHNLNITICELKIKHILKFLSEVENKIVKENDHFHTDLWPNDQSPQLGVWELQELFSTLSTMCNVKYIISPYICRGLAPTSN